MRKLVLAAIAALTCSSAAYAGVTEQDLAKDAETVGDVLTNGMGRNLQRFSPMETLNTKNVKNLMPAWAFSLGGEKQRGQESQPIIYDGIMYITGSYSRLYAIDVKTGKEVWQYDARLPEGILPCCDVVNRGAAIYGDNIYFGTLDARLVALNRKTGDVVWSKKLANYKEGYSYTAAPLIVNGLVVTGNSGGEFGIVGEVQARNAGKPVEGNKGDNLYAASRLGIDPENGEIKWHFQTTPREGWDFDGVNEVVPFVDKDGNKRFATADRNGFFYVLNREDGKFVSAHPFVKNISCAKGIDETGRPIYNEDNRRGDAAAAADGAKGQQVFAVPSFLGGKNWMPMAYSPKTGLFYVPSNEWGMDIWNEPISYKKGAAYLGAGFTIKPLFEDHIGSLKAIDPNTGEIKWVYKNGAPLWGGAVPLWGGEVAKKVNYLNQGGMVWTFRLPKQLASLN